MDKLGGGIAAGSSHIPNKLYFRIGEVSDLVGVKPYVLRYWESEFPDIKPSKSKSGQRLYKRRDVDMLLKIKELLYDERFTINGARKRLKEIARTDGRAVSVQPQSVADMPHQLEAFPEVIEDETEEAVVTVSGGDKIRDTKILVKIKRDLEGLLAVVRG